MAIKRISRGLRGLSPVFEKRIMIRTIEIQPLLERKVMIHPHEFARRKDGTDEKLRAKEEEKPHVGEGPERIDQDQRQ
jgi:hypothetical protein